MLFQSPQMCWAESYKNPDVSSEVIDYLQPPHVQFSAI